MLALKSVIKCLLLFSNVNLYVFLVCFKVERNLKFIFQTSTRGQWKSTSGQLNV